MYEDNKMKSDKFLKGYFEESNLSFMKEIPFKNLYFDKRAKLMCKFGCKNYQRKHSCPPASLKILDKVKKYNSVILFATTSEYPDESSFFKKRGFNYEKEFEIQRISEELDNKLSKLGIDHFVLSGGSCKRCNDCSFKDGEPCKKPERKQISMEAVGIDCQKTLHEAGFDFNLADESSVNRCGCILLNNNQEFSNLDLQKEKSYQNYRNPTRKEAEEMCIRLEEEYPKFFDEVYLSKISDFIFKEKICDSTCEFYDNNYSCPPYSKKLDLDLWDYSVVWKWSESKYKKYRYTEALKKIHGAFYSLGYYFALSLRDCNCEECDICNYKKENKIYCENRKMLAPSIQSQDIDSNQFGEGKYGIELI